ncbi:MAG TPA: DNA repair protein RadC [Acholeplasmataceae bacterium]|nr:DNA repair protein RadC [Acholeplasmataceae bacterium]
MSYMVREMPLADRPRERLVKYGATSLANYELLAIILGTGTKDKSVLDLAKKVLIEFEELNRLNEVTVNELMKIKGIGKAKAISIIAAIEFGKRVNQPINLGVRIKDSRDAYNFLKDSLQNEMQENLVCIYLNNNSEVINVKTISIGSISNTIFNPRDILKWALKYSAVAIILAHNHPSGNITPSMEDVIVTKNIIKAAKIVDILVVDHIIIGKNRFYSFLENRKL